MTGRTIAGTYNTGISLTDPGDNPVTVLSGGIIDTGNGVALQGSSGTYWTIGNAGLVEATGATAGNIGVLLAGGGAVTNLTGGTIGGYDFGVSITGTGSVNNASAALIAGAVSGVMLGPGTLGTVTNAGSIFGYRQTGVALSGGGSASNASAARIGGRYFGLRASNTASSVVNFGSIYSVQTLTGSQTFDAAGVNLVAGGTVSNGQTGRITAAWKGVEIGATGTHASGTVLNQGFIYASNSNGSTGAGVWINGPAMISNAASGTIAGGPFAIVAYDTTTLVNYGTIGGSDFAFDAVNAGFAESVAVAPGATFVGVVSGGNTIGSSVVSTLEFKSGNQAGSLSGIGSHYVEFGHITIDSGASWLLTGSNTLAAGGTLTNSGTLLLLGTTLINAGVLENDGVIALDPSLLQVTNLTGNGALTLGAGSTIDSQGTIAAGETITFASTAAPLLQLEAPGSMAGSVVGFAQGDTIDLAGVDPASVQYTAGILSFSVGGSAASFALGLASKASLLPPSSDGNGGTQITALCFCTGTRITTRDGDIAIEHLQVGDLVRVVHPRNELQPVLWIGHRTVNCARHPNPRTVWPVRIAAGAFGPGRPYRDLKLSPDHAVFVDDVLIPVKYLINGTTIRQTPMDEVNYHHVELSRHAVLLAAGMFAESYLDTGGRGNFANGGEPVALHPDFTFRTWDAEGCAPLVVTGPLLQSAQERIGAFANTIEHRRRHSLQRNAVSATKRR